jgi:hypothetical protein
VILRDALYTHQQQQHGHHHNQQQQEAGHGHPPTSAGVPPVQTPRGLAGEVVAARVGESWFRAAAGSSSVAQSATTCQALSHLHGPKPVFHHLQQHSVCCKPAVCKDGVSRHC